MFEVIKGFALAMMLVLTQLASAADDVSRDKIKGLDEQVQDIKQDVLAISTELLQLEEKLIYPSNTQVSVFVSMAADQNRRVDSVDIRVDGEDVMHHVYTHKELEALQSGGVQRIYTGNVRAGQHQLEVIVSGENFQETASHTFNKEQGPRLVEITLFESGNTINFKDR
ncbi:hypothetical protein MWU49_10720 [Alcanivorax sp. S6407]|uniref:hypothetical protein n=1 Tax=Alcanivorax sp. S6407 TaxID=2926424 RepID=UPI001FF2C197|nr:hypothetical protein [Alcanivorax sp. S6407]MCK0154176.1 hypothetical protein [Alcanivorax sp. S6407]